MPSSSRLHRLSSHVAPQAVPCGTATITAAVLGALGGAAVTHFAHRRAQEQSAEPASRHEAPRAPRPHAVTTQAELRALLPPRPAGVGNKVHGTGVADAIKVIDHLDEQMVGYIQKSPFLQLGTADAAGLPFVSPKGDEAGFVMVVDERTLAIPDRPGNSILMGLQNVLANPRAGICFEIPGYGTTLRVGGRAEISNDPELLHRLEARGLDAMLAIVVEIDYAFFHCSKAYLRSRLWEPDSWASAEDQYQVNMSQYFAESEEEQARLDMARAATYDKFNAAVAGEASEVSTRADAASPADPRR